MDKSRSEKYEALAQRCIPIRFTLTPDQLDQIMQGKPFYEYQEHRVKSETNLSRHDYDRITKIARAFREEYPEFQEVYARAVGDICRITSVLGLIDVRLSRLVCYLKTGYRIEQALQLVEKEGES